MGEGLGLDAWWDEPAYRASQETFTERGAFILDKLRAHDPARLATVLEDIYRDGTPDPADITKFEWGTILRYLGASDEEVADAQKANGEGVAVSGVRHTTCGAMR